jgi:hypothetical protein
VIVSHDQQIETKSASTAPAQPGKPNQTELLRLSQRVANLRRPALIVFQRAIFDRLNSIVQRPPLLETNYEYYSDPAAVHHSLLISTERFNQLFPASVCYFFAHRLECPYDPCSREHVLIDEHTYAHGCCP